MRVIQGDCRGVMRGMEPASVHCVVTSPPYWNLRDYGVEGQLGNEPSPEEYLANMMEVFQEVRRVLRNDGTLWLNMGDCYANDTKWGGSTGGKHVKSLHGESIGREKRSTGLPPKSLVGMPWRLALALQAEGWTLRSDIVWSKPSPMPESVNDRPTKSHEYIFLLTKNSQYYYDAYAIRESVTGGAHIRGGGVNPKAVPPGKGPHSRQRQNESFGRAVRHLVTSRNKRTAWEIPSQPYSGAHFATYPEELVRPCILAGTSARGCCSNCGVSWERQVIEEGPTINEQFADRAPGAYAGASIGNPHSFSVRGSHNYVERTHKTVGWSPGCDCGAKDVPCTILDPFAGSGTTGAVAAKLGRDFVGIELKPDYVKLAEKRILEAKERMGQVTANDAESAGRPVQLGLLK